MFDTNVAMLVSETNEKFSENTFCEAKQIASIEVVNPISERLIEQNREAYKILAKGE